MGRSSLARVIIPPSIGWLRGLNSQSGIAWRALDSSGVRAFLGSALTHAVTDCPTISRSRTQPIERPGHPSRLWVLQCLGIAGLVKGKTVSIDATTLEANALL